MKNLVGGIVVYLALVALVVVVVHNIIEGFSETDSSMKNMVGNEVVIKGDTLMIIDYSMLSGSFVLEDGRKISVELAEKLGTLDQK